MTGFFPVDRDIFSSSLWISGTPEERVLWIWLLGHKDKDGVVPHRELAIADGAKLPRSTVEQLLVKFSGPDPDSRTGDNEGRRIGRTDDGFVRILNHDKYFNKDYSTPRWRKWRERQRSNAFANAPTRLPTNNKDTDTDTNRQRIAPAAPRAVVKAPSWTREACDDWTTAYNGTAPGGRIGKALAPLVKQHGWDAVRTAWRAYLSQTEAEYASPQRFASTFGRWTGTAPATKPKAGTVQDRTQANLMAWIDSKEGA